MTNRIRDIEHKVLAVLADKCCMDVEQISLQSDLIEDLGMDSLDAVEAVFEFEEAYGIEIPDEQIREFRLVQDIVDYLVPRLPSEEAGPA